MEKEKQKNSGLLRGAATIALGGFIAKAIGAVYRIPLTNFIGGEGIGLYQLVYPFYCLLLTVSATGIPSSIATLTAKTLAGGGSARPLFKTCIRLFLWIGAVSTLLMMVLAPLLARAQGEPQLWSGYLALAPSVLLVSAISVFRGYFQGHNRMFPTALSEVLEQVVKVGIGLVVAYLFRGNLYRSVTVLLAAVTASEAAALIYLWICFHRTPAPNKTTQKSEKTACKTVLRLSIPVTLSACLIPLFGLIDSVLIVRLLRPYAQNAVAQYGLFSGGAVTVINLPVSVCYGIAAASVPALSAAVRKGASGRKKLLFSLLLTLGVSSLAAVGLYLFAEPAVRVLYRSLTAEELATLSGLVKRFSFSAVTLSCAQTLSACLTALERPSRAALSMAISMLIKTVMNCLLLSNPRVGIYGAAMAANVGYALAFLLNLVFAWRATGKSGRNGR